jgi:WD40 repeat protein
VWRVCVSADGKRVLTSSADKTLRLWDTRTGQQLRVIEDHTSSTKSAALSQDGKRVLSGSDDGTVRLWDADTGKERLKMTGHTDGVYGVAFGPEGQALSCSKDRTMRLWDLNTGKNTVVFTGNTNPESEVAYGEGQARGGVGQLREDSPVESRNRQEGPHDRRRMRHERLLLAGRQASADGRQ